LYDDDNGGGGHGNDDPHEWIGKIKSKSTAKRLRRVVQKPSYY